MRFEWTDIERIGSQVFSRDIYGTAQLKGWGNSLLLLCSHAYGRISGLRDFLEQNRGDSNFVYMMVTESIGQLGRVADLMPQADLDRLLQMLEQMTVDISLGKK